VQKHSKLTLANSVESPTVSHSDERPKAATPKRSGQPPITQNSHETTNAKPVRIRRIEKVKAGVAALPKPKFDIVDAAVLYRETVRELEFYQKRVNEGLDLEAAHRFCNYVRNSLLEKFFKLNAPDCALGWMEADKVREVAGAMDWQIREMWRTCKVVKKYDEGQVEALNRKSDEQAAQLQKLTAQLLKLTSRQIPRRSIPRLLKEGTR